MEKVCLFCSRVYPVGEVPDVCVGRPTSKISQREIQFRIQVASGPYDNVVVIQSRADDSVTHDIRRRFPFRTRRAHGTRLIIAVPSAARRKCFICVPDCLRRLVDPIEQFKCFPRPPLLLPQETPWGPLEPARTR